MHTSEFTNEGAQAWAIAGLMSTWHLRFEVATASLALALLEEKMVHFHLDRW
jgi:hypothetical protein